MSSIPSAADTALINKLSMPTCRLQQMPVRVWDWWASKAEGGGAMMSMCPHVIDALRWVPSLQHRITRPGIVCSHDTATNVACCVQLPCIAVQHCAVRALQVVKMRKSMLYCCSVSGSHAIKLWLCSVHSSLYAAQPWLTEVLHDNLDLWSVECSCLAVCPLMAWPINQAEEHLLTLLLAHAAGSFWRQRCPLLQHTCRHQHRHCWCAALPLRASQPEQPCCQLQLQGQLCTLPCNGRLDFSLVSVLHSSDASMQHLAGLWLGLNGATNCCKCAPTGLASA